MSAFEVVHRPHRITHTYAYARLMYRTRDAAAAQPNRFDVNYYGRANIAWLRFKSAANRIQRRRLRPERVTIFRSWTQSRVLIKTLCGIHSFELNALAMTCRCCAVGRYRVACWSVRKYHIPYLPALALAAAAPSRVAVAPNVSGGFGGFVDWTATPTRIHRHLRSARTGVTFTIHQAAPL